MITQLFNKFSTIYGTPSFTVVGFYVLMAVGRKSAAFWDVTPRNLVKSLQTFRSNILLHVQGRRVSKSSNQPEAEPFVVCFLHVACLVYPSTLNIEAVCSSETLAHFYQTTRRCIYKTVLFIAVFTASSCVILFRTINSSALTT
jgi:hypothetical protein